MTGRDTFPWGHFYRWMEDFRVRREEERWQWHYRGGLERYEAARAATIAMQRGRVLHVHHAVEQDDESFVDQVFTAGGQDRSLIDWGTPGGETLTRGEPEAQLAILLTRYTRPGEVLAAVEASC